MLSTVIVWLSKLFQGKSVNIKLFERDTQYDCKDPKGFCKSILKSKSTETVIGNKQIQEMLKPLYKTQQKLSELQKSGYVREMADWTTYLTPGEPGYIHGELIHPIISGNGVDYTAEELIPAVNTLIGKPIFKVPNSEIGPQSVLFPEDLHRDPMKGVFGSIELAKYKDGAINFLAKVDDETYKQVKDRKLPRGSIEADFMVKAQSDKNAAQFKPEFITFTGYLLLPEWAQPGDSLTKNQVYETVKQRWSCECPSMMAPRSK